MNALHFARSRKARVLLGLATVVALATGIALPRIAHAAGTVSVSSGNVTEGATGLSAVTVTFTLSEDNSEPVSAHYKTVDTGSATKDVDYVDQAGTVDFAPHEISKQVVFHAKGDQIDEPNETFRVQVDSVTGGGVTPANPDFGTVTILDDDQSAPVSIANVTKDEGTGGTRTIDFVVKLSQPAGVDTTYYAYTDDPRDPEPNNPNVNAPLAATPTTDYTPLTGTAVVVKAGKTSPDNPVSVNIVTDSVDEFDEHFELQLKATQNAEAPDVAFATGKIVDDDALARLDVSDPAAFTEDDTACGGLGQDDCETIDFVVTLTPASNKRVVVNFATADRSATAGSDYDATSGSGDPQAAPPNDGDGLSFAPGETTKHVLVPIHGDNANEADERFVLNLSSPVNAQLGDAQAFGLILSDDNPPAATVNIANATDVPEQSGPASFTVTVTNGQPLTNYQVFYTTADGSESPTDAKATAPSDYTAAPANSSITINYPQTTGTITVPVINDTKDEAPEFFQVQLTDASNANIGDPVGTAKIVDNDPAPTLAIADKTVTEGTGATATKATMTVTLTPASGQEVTVDYATDDDSGTADAPADYAPAAGKLTFAPGETSKTFDVDVAADSLDEENTETVDVALSNQTGGATISDGLATLTITDDDNAPTVSIADTSVTEGSTGTSTATFTVSLSAPSGKSVTVKATTSDGTATQPGDYSSKTATVTIPAGEPSADFEVSVVGDDVEEPNENFTVTLTEPTNSTIADGTAAGTILDDEAGPTPTLSIADASATEGSPVTFAATLSQATDHDVTFSIATADGTAATPGDYGAQAPTVVTIPAGQTQKALGVATVDDTTDEATETFTLTASTPVGATISDGTATGSIVDNDNPPTGSPTISVNDSSGSEGDKVTFTLTLSAATDHDVTATVTTSGGNAAVTDYTPLVETPVTIATGQTTKTFDVQTTEDTDDEVNETFNVTVGNPLGATVADGTGVGTITDDDGISIAPNLATGPGPGGGPHIKVFTADASSAPVQFMDGDKTSGKRVARGDLNGDGVDEIITGSGPGEAAIVSAYSSTGQLIASSFAYGSNGGFFGGIFVGAGDTNGDGNDEIITSPGPGGGPHVRAWTLSGQSLVGNAGFMAYTPNFAGGVTVGAADVDGDGKDDVLTAPGAGGGPHVRAFSGATGNELFGFMAFTDPNAQPNWTGGINVAGGDLDGDGKAEIAVGPWRGGGPHLRLFKHDGSLLHGGVMALNPNFRGGITVTMGDLSGDGKAEIVVGAMTEFTGFRAFKADLTPIGDGKEAYPNFGGGVFVAIGKS